MKAENVVWPLLQTPGFLPFNPDTLPMISSSLINVPSDAHLPSLLTATIGHFGK